MKMLRKLRTEGKFPNVIKDINETSMANVMLSGESF